MDKQIRKIERKVKKGEESYIGSLKALERADKKRDKVVDKAKKIVKRKK